MCVQIDVSGSHSRYGLTGSGQTLAAGGARASAAGVLGESPRLSSVGADQVPDLCDPGLGRRCFFGPHERTGTGGPQSLSDAGSGVGDPIVSVTLTSTGTVRPRRDSYWVGRSGAQRSSRPTGCAACPANGRTRPSPRPAEPPYRAGWSAEPASLGLRLGQGAFFAGPPLSGQSWGGVKRRVETGRHPAHAPRRRSIQCP